MLNTMNNGTALMSKMEQEHMTSTKAEIVFKNLTFTVKVQEAKTKKLVEKVVLRNIQGIIQPSRLTSCMGASGAGKTSLLNILAGFSDGSATGDICVNGEVAQGRSMRDISAYVFQEDVVLATMTVREALIFAARLRLPVEVPDVEKVSKALYLADQLNLTRSLDTMIGSHLIKGISGGEKKRLAIGMGLITNPSILFLDEPTTGLDSFNAYKVMMLLQRIAHQNGRTVVATIHQPSSDIFHMFDDLIVLSNGQMMYQGLACEMVPYFATQGFVCPRYTNPADFLFMSILNVPEGQVPSAVPVDLERGNSGGSNTPASRNGSLNKVSPEIVLPAAERIQALLEAWSTGSRQAAINEAIGSREQKESGDKQNSVFSGRLVIKKTPFWFQCRMLAMRALLNMNRNSLVLRARLFQALFLSVLVGLIFLRLGTDYSDIQDREGSLFLVEMVGVFLPAIGAISVFGTERAVFSREYGSRMYGLSAYFWSRYFTELPLHIFAPLLMAVIMYFMIGYQLTAAKFWIFASIFIVTENVGCAFGILCACVYNDITLGIQVLRSFLMPMMLVSGFFVNSATMPEWIGWLQYPSPMKYGFAALIKNEFNGLVISCNAAEGCTDYELTGEQVIAGLSLTNEGSIAFNIGIQLLLTGGFLLGAFGLLGWVVRREKL